MILDALQEGGLNLLGIRRACGSLAPDNVAEAVRYLRATGQMRLESTGCYYLNRGEA